MRTLIGKTLVGVAAFWVGSATAASILDDSYPSNSPISFEQMHKVVSAEFLDPNSAQYKMVSLHAQPGRGDVFCGWVNSKNSFGGYTRFYPFWMSVEKNDSIVNPDYDDDILADLSNLTFGMYGCKDKLGM